MPLEIHERLWQEPGPEQSAPGAPKLLIVYPLANQGPTELEALRYAGRVEPADAVVTLNGAPLKLWPGGVFTGLQPIGPGPAETWHFVASKGGLATVVDRALRRPEPPTPPPAWPPTFDKAPVSPAGEYWLPPKTTLKVTLYASPGLRAQVRIGAAGAWQPMTPAGQDPERGGVYTAELTPPPPLTPPRSSQVFFRIAGERDGQTLSKELASGLKLATLPAQEQLVARVKTNLATFLKDRTTWQRWGNWIRDTPFPVLEWRADRLRTGFGRGEAGWIETEGAEIDTTKYEAFALPRLGVPALKQARQALTLSWPQQNQPLAALFYPQQTETGDLLRINLPGAQSLPSFTRNLAPGSPFASVAGLDGAGPAAPSLALSLREPLWGFAMQCPPGEGLRLIARVRPRLAGAGVDRPLAGLRIMLDAGHGGESFGERGPSGVLEKDLNLVEAAWLERDLRALGADVRQTRRADEDVELDERVDMALAWNPDLFISLHHNSVPLDIDPLSKSGPTVYYHYAHSQPLAEALGGAMARRFDPGRAPLVLPEVFRVMRNVSLCPAVLIESAFVCNPEDELRLRRTETLKAEARAVAEAVKGYMAGRAALTDDLSNNIAPEGLR